MPPRPSLALLVLVSCWSACDVVSPGNVGGPDASRSAHDAGSPTDAAVTPDDLGYAIVGLDIHPPLRHRVTAVTCPSPAAEACSPDDNLGTNVCLVGSDCADGFCADNPYGCGCYQATCRSDADCAANEVCACDGVGGVHPNICIPAECRTDDDCDGLCLLSLGALSQSKVPSSDCCGFTLRLVCERGTSTCRGGEDCLGNGNACAYVEEWDRFECSARATCTCE
ncbi:MAG: hypothetical protein AB2A00_28615 [Myxococcota bacterium]